jgi:hypothetical protein
VCHAYTNADREIREGILIIEGVWLKTESQLDVLHGIWHTLSERVQTHQNNVLEVLQERLEITITILEGLQAGSTESDGNDSEGFFSKPRVDTRRLKFAAIGKWKLDQAVKNLEKWHTKFDPSWYLLARTPAPSMDDYISTKESSPSKELFVIRELRTANKLNNEPVSANSGSSVFLPNNFRIHSRERISNASADMGVVGHELVIVDSLHVAEGANPQIAMKDARDIARKLASVDPIVFSLLPCLGVTKRFASPARIDGFELIFALPTGFKNPRSLRTILLGDSQYPLDDRFRLARLLARSVSFLHSSRIVHKNITPETILLLQDASSDALDAPFLIGFEKFRFAEGRTYMTGDPFWEKNMYRHPRRQGELPEEEYKMQHDIYSLGVCLLEIGLGSSFVRFEGALVRCVQYIIVHDCNEKDIPHKAS